MKPPQRTAGEVAPDPQPAARAAPTGTAARLGPGAVGVAGLAGAVGLIAVLTLVSRAAGFGRTAVFLWTVTAGPLGDIYLAANTVPNIIFEIVAGGALASLVVPLLAGAVARGDRATVAATTSALLTWSLLLLIPLAVLVAVFAEPIVGALARDAGPAAVGVGARMLRVFAPQLPLYGVGIVLTGLLQAHHRFAWPVIAPLLSSVTVIGTYLTFAAVQGRGTALTELTGTGELILSGGTTLGVVVLSLCLVLPVRRLGLRLRPRLGFPAGARGQAVRLGWAGVVTVGAQHLALLLLLTLAFGRGTPQGTYTSFIAAQTVYLLPWAVLAVPLATAAYPRLAAAHSGTDVAGYQATLAGATRSVVLLSCLGAAALVAAADPVARLLDVPAAAAGITGFAPGLLGYGLFAVLSRALYARGDTLPAAVATATGWAVTAGAALLLSAALPGDDRVAALSVANATGMAALGALLVVAVRRSAGAAALAGLGRTTVLGLAAGLVAAAAGRAVWVAVDRLVPTPALGVTVLQGMLVGVVVVVAFGAVAYPLDRRQLRPLVGTVARRLRRLAGRGTPGPHPAAAPDGSVDGPAVDSPAADGPAVDGPAVDQPAGRGPVAHRPEPDPKEAP